MATASSPRKKARSSPVDHHEVNRAEFNDVRQTVTEMQSTVSTLLEVSQSQERAITKIDSSIGQVVDQINNLAKLAAAEHGSRGTITVSNVWHGLGFLAAFSAILSGVIMFAIRAETITANTTVSHNSLLLKDLAAEMKEHMQTDGHPGMMRRVEAVQSQVRANEQDNETRHRWMADVINLHADWQYRTRGIEVPPPNQRLLHGIGEK